MEEEGRGNLRLKESPGFPGTCDACGRAHATKPWLNVHQHAAEATLNILKSGNMKYKGSLKFCALRYRGCAYRWQALRINERRRREENVGRCGDTGRRY